MKKLILSTLAVGILGVSQSFALMVQMNSSPFIAATSGNYQARPYDGLEYVLGNYTLGKTTDGTWFGTFCVELDEYFSDNGLYDVALNSMAIAGGNNTNSGDTISVGTAYLYEQFATGNLAAIGYSYNDQTSARKLQDMIWHLEENYALTAGGSVFTSLLVSQFTSLANAKLDYTGSAVKVMNLTQHGGKRQDQLVYLGVPDGGLTLGLLGLSLVGLAAFRRRLNH